MKNIISGIIILFVLFVITGKAFSGGTAAMKIVSVFTSKPDGYSLIVCGGISERFSAVMISAVSSSFNTSSEDCAAIYSPSHGMPDEKRHLNYRIYFLPETHEGTFSLPVSVIAYPL